MADDFVLPSEQPAEVALPSDSAASQEDIQLPSNTATQDPVSAGFKFVEHVPGVGPIAKAAEYAGLPQEIWRAGKQAASTINDNLNPWSDAAQAKQKQVIEEARRNPLNPVPGLEQTLGVGKGLMAVPAVAAAPVTGAARMAIGKPYSYLTGSPQHPEDVLPQDRASGTISGEEAADLAMMGMRPAGAPVKTLPGPGYVPKPNDIPVTRPAYEWGSFNTGAAPVPPTGDMLGVTLSEGQRTGQLPLIQKEQAALRSDTLLGKKAHERAKAFEDQQRQQVEAAREDLRKSLDPGNQVLANSPQEAGEVISNSVQAAKNRAKASVNQQYDYARNQPGDVHAGVFEGIGPKIKADLSMRPEPVVIDDMLTPFASKAIQDIDNRVANLQIQNRANPFGQPPANTISGINLAGVDQMRKRLSTFRQNAYQSGNAADGRAAQAVLDAFDERIDHAINNGLFSGDKRAIEAWNDARTAYSDYRRIFTAQHNDPIGRVVERITGKSNNPAAIPNDVADYIYGSTGVNPSSLNVGVANRIKGILGESSPEWAAVKQGLFSRLTEAGTGATEFGPGKVAQRLNKFLNVDGREMSRTMFSPSERQLLQTYANLMRKLEVPQRGANWSNTAPFAAPLLKQIDNKIASVIGAVIGHAIAPGLHGVGEGLGAAVTGGSSGLFRNMRNAREITKQMPLVAEQTQRYQKALRAYNRNNAVANQKILGVAAANLTKTLGNLGIDVNALALPGTVGAEENEKKRAEGGAVNDDNSIGDYTLSPQGIPQITITPGNPRAKVGDESFGALPSGATVPLPPARPAEAPQPSYYDRQIAGPGEQRDIRTEGTGYPVIDKLTGLGGQERYQTWPEQMLRSGATLPGDAYSGETAPQQIQPEVPGMWSEEDEFRQQIANQAAAENVIHRAQDTAGLAGGSSFGATHAGVIPENAIGMAGGKLPEGWRSIEGAGQPKPLNTPEQIAAFRAANEGRSLEPASKQMQVKQLYSPQEMLQRGERFDIADPSKLGIQKSRTLGENPRDMFFVTQPHREYPESRTAREVVTGFSSKEEAEGFIKAVQNQQKRPENWTGPKLYSDSAEAGAPIAALERPYSSVEEAVRSAPLERAAAMKWLETLRGQGVDQSKLDALGLSPTIAQLLDKYSNNKPVTKQFLLNHIKNAAPPDRLFTDSSKAGAPLAALEKSATPFYSQLQRTIEKAPQQKMHGSQWANWLRNQPGIKQEELEWTGLGNYLNEQKGLVNKDQVLAKAKENHPELQEAWKGVGPQLGDTTLQPMVDFELRNWRDRFTSKNGREASPEEVASAREHYTKAIQAEPRRFGLEPENEPRFDRDDLKLPGGENYRELLLKLPDTKPQYLKDIDAKAFRGEKLSDAEVAQVAAWAAGPKTHYSSSHWPDDPNTVAHLRMNDRDIPGVGKSLHLEELQSDWGQAGRKQGYQDLSKRKLEVRPAENGDGWAVFDPEIGQVSAGALGQRDAEALATEWSSYKKNTGVPNMPFKQSWPDLLLKRAIREAAEQGKDAISWTPGEQQAARYDLSKQVEAIRVSRNGDLFSLYVNPKAHSGFDQLATNVPASKLADYVGKDLAEKIAGQESRDHEYSGLDLKVGSEGMKGFYDKMLVDKANAIGKKYGAKVEWKDLPNSNPEGGTIHSRLSTKVPVLRLTPKLKDAALKEGFALFSDTGKPGAAISAAENSRLRNAEELWHEYAMSPHIQEAVAGKLPEVGQMTRGGYSINEAELPKIKEAAKVLADRAATGLIPYTHGVWRGIVLPEGTAPTKEFPRNKIVAFDQLTAVTPSKDLAAKYTDPQYIGAESGVPVLFNIQRRGGVVGHEFGGDFPEAVIPPGSRYRVTSTKKVGDHYVVTLYDSGGLNKQQKKVPGEPGQEPYAGKEDQPQYRAAGGRVEPKNINTSPSEAQKQAGNYAKDKVHIHGLEISIENPRGSTRRGVGPNGPWAAKLACHYGYLLRQPLGKDGDHLDVYLGPHLKSKHVFVIDQVNADTGKFDEHKICLCFVSKTQALAYYKKCFSDGKGHRRVGNIVELTLPQLKHWLANGDMDKPIAAYGPVKAFAA